MKKLNLNKNKKKVVYIILSIAAIFLLVFCLYDSPAKYVPNQDGKIYLNQKGEPIIYYTDLFGNEFYQDGIRRVYAAVPAMAQDTPIAVNENTSSTQNNLTDNAVAK